jgi:predicted porin
MRRAIRAERVLDGRPLCGDAAIHRRDRLLRRKQFAYATGADAGCSSTVSGACSGNFNAASVSLDYHFTKRFDTYAGAMWSNVSHGLASGYLNTTMIDPTIGVRFSF